MAVVPGMLTPTGFLPAPSHARFIQLYFPRVGPRLGPLGSHAGWGRIYT